MSCLGSVSLVPAPASVLTCLCKEFSCAWYKVGSQPTRLAAVVVIVSNTGLEIQTLKL